MLCDVQALRATVQRWTDESAHEKARRIAAEALVRAAAGLSDTTLNDDGSLSTAQQQYLRQILDAVSA